MLDSVYTSVTKAVRIFRLHEDGTPDLVDLGIPAVRARIGGMFAGNLVAIAAAQNVGKSSMALSMLLRSSDRGGYLSLEDGEDVVGTRLIAAAANVDPTKIRRKDLSAGDLDRINAATERLSADTADGPRFAYRVGARVDEVEEAVAELADDGCRWVVLDYLQKVRGHHRERRCEVGETMVRFQRVCVKHDMVPVIVSQLVRLPPGTEPFPNHMKESGDIENECRMIVLLWRDGDDSSIVHGKVAKSSFGGGGMRFRYMYNEAEVLIPEEEWPQPVEEW